MGQKGGTAKRSIKYRPPTIQGGEDYTVNRLDQANRERMFGEERQIPGMSVCSGFFIKTYTFRLINS